VLDLHFSRRSGPTDADASAAEIASHYGDLDEGRRTFATTTATVTK